MLVCLISSEESSWLAPRSVGGALIEAAIVTTHILLCDNSAAGVAHNTS